MYKHVMYKCYQYAQACDVKVLSICTSKIVLIFGIIDFKFKTHLFNFLKAAVSALWSSSVIYYKKNDEQYVIVCYFNISNLSNP